MSALAQFKAVHSSGLLLFYPAEVTALSLLFEKVYLPNNVEMVIDFAKHHRLTLERAPGVEVTTTIVVTDESGQAADPFAGLAPFQRETVMNYLEWCYDFSLRYSPLFKKVFKTDLFEDSHPLKAELELVKEGPPGKPSQYMVTLTPAQMQLAPESEDGSRFASLVSEGYVPLISSFDSGANATGRAAEASSRQLAGLLAMKSVGMIFPATQGAHPEVILEARERLRDHLPPFWSAMLKASIGLKERLRESGMGADAVYESQEFVDTLVRPALIDLQSKMLKERKDWFYRILSPVQQGLRLMIANPPLTQQQIVANALMLGSDAAMGAAGKLHAMQSLGSEAGLTFLLEAEKALVPKTPNRAARRKKDKLLRPRKK